MQGRMIQNNRTYLMEFESLNEMLQVARDTAPNGQCSNGANLFRDLSDSFIGRPLKSWDDVDKAINSPWQQGLNVLEDILNQIKDRHLPPPTSLRRKSTWSEDSGDDLDLDRLRRGQAYWRSSHRVTRPGPMNVTIVSDMTTSGATDSARVLYRGAASIALTQMLEDAGYRVELWVGDYGTSYGSTCGAEVVCMKRAGDMLDVSSMVNVLSGWFYRTVLFAAIASPTHLKTQYGFGGPLPLRQIISDVTPDEKAFLSENIWSTSEAVAWVADKLAIVEGRSHMVP